MLSPLLTLLSPALAGSTSTTVHAKVGGTISDDGITVTIPAGALSADTVVTLTASEPMLSKEHPSAVLPISYRYQLDLGKAELIDELAFTLETPSKASGLSLDTDRVLVAFGDEDGDLHLSAGEPGKADLSASSTLLDVTLVQILKPLDSEADILQVPFYLQDGLNWCTPTALSMLLGYHSAPFPDLESWEIAGLHGLDRGTGGTPNYSVMETLTDEFGLDETVYEFYYWDDNLIGGTDAGGEVDDTTVHEALGTTLGGYLALQNTGYNLQDFVGDVYEVAYPTWGFKVSVADIDVPPRPVQMTSSILNHAFAGVGVTDFGVYVHDSATAVTGTRGPVQLLTWADFYSTVFSVGTTDELRTVALNAPVRDESARRGSLILTGGGWSNGNSLHYTRGGSDEAEWFWDGSPWSEGGAWARPDTPASADTNRLHGSVLAPGGELEYSLGIANITDTTRKYAVVAHITLPGDDEDEEVMEAEAPAYSITAAVSGSLSIPDDTKSGYGIIHFELLEDDVHQDDFWVSFEVD